MIADLEEVSQILGDRKIKVDRVIQALKLEDDTVAVEHEEAQPNDNVVDDLGVDVQGEDYDASPSI
ncbi:hypothetical protein A2U01_0034419 [Trifolium medium]|uniref:Uncharacterized protein n=1 Tax=Trifolium medium TaxID=97028 RepID=A0A392PNG7_9FABA|nr:hypothetical protein [Trifolium medium]